jgi:hypothetical protein
MRDSGRQERKGSLWHNWPAPLRQEHNAETKPQKQERDHLPDPLLMRTAHLLHSEPVQSGQILGGKENSHDQENEFHYPEQNLVGAPHVGPTVPSIELQGLMSKYLID